MPLLQAARGLAQSLLLAGKAVAALAVALQQLLADVAQLAANALQLLLLLLHTALALLQLLPPGVAVVALFLPLLVEQADAHDGNAADAHRDVDRADGQTVAVVEKGVRHRIAVEQQDADGGELAQADVV